MKSPGESTKLGKSSGIYLVRKIVLSLKLLRQLFYLFWEELQFISAVFGKKCCLFLYFGSENCLEKSGNLFYWESGNSDVPVLPMNKGYYFCHSLY